MNSNLRTALITGGTSGIGRAVAKQLASLGIRVIVAGRNEERGNQTVDAIRNSGGKANFIQSDLGDASSARILAKCAIDLSNGHIDILVNNAGTYPSGLTHEMGEKDFEYVYALNVKTPYFLVAELAPLMAEKGSGTIINVSSIAAEYGISGVSLYGSSKAAINYLTKVWAAEYGPNGVRVNTVSPGPTYTEGTESVSDGIVQMASQAPARRPASADEIASAISFLATEHSSFVYGAKLIVDGGITAI
ncbi:SDR family oxidoreductase [Priestia endophytica]|uniref:SDR family NAD(P)-dependent oxidoreductase n=1 Tax=Priestia endophytica TaxID=135735 RepID=UPI003D287AB8